MKRIVLLALAVCLLGPHVSYAAKTTYIATNHRFNYVKLKEVKNQVAAERNMTHPVQINEQGLREALRSVKLSRSYLIKKEVDTQSVFDDASVDFLAPNLAKAFSEANSREEVVFSYLMKNPLFILRNDRLNLGQMWISGDELHINFDKLYAKVTGDTDKRGNEGRAIARAQGLRIKLELGPGQQMSFNNPGEVILNLHYNYAEMPEQAKPLPTTTKTMAGESVAVPGMGEGQAGKASSSTGATMASNSAAEAGAAMGAGSVKERLEALEVLKKEGMITNKEYMDKRKEILNDL